MRKNTVVACSLILPFFLINPAVIYYLNPQFEDLSVTNLLVVFLVISVTLIALLSIIFRVLPATAMKWAVVIALSVAMAAYVQAQIISPMLELDLTGETIDWSFFTARGFIEIVLLLIFTTLVGLLAWRLFEFRHLLAGVILAGAVVSGVFEAVGGVETYAVSNQSTQQQVDKAAFEFSSTKNIIHLMPDAVQTDVAARILRENDGLAKAFDGFFLFENHLGGFHSTAPTLPSVFAGELYDLSNGYQAPDVRRFLRERSYANTLAGAGFHLDFATASPLVCVGQGARCVHLPFGDFRSRGYATAPNAWLVDFGLLIDLSLFRQLPLLMKQLVYDNGAWLLSNWAAEASVDYFKHAPVLNEWSKLGRVADDEPRFKWYHWIGAHAPQMWDGNCTYIGHQPWDSESVEAQTECVLRKIASFLDSLRDMDIYEQTFVVISSDHGTNQYPQDLDSYLHTELFRPGELGTARPLLMVKPFENSNELEFSPVPTSIVDIAPTILGSVGLSQEFSGMNIFDMGPEVKRNRYYHKYARPPFRWGPNPVPIDRWLVLGDVRDWNNWKPLSFHMDSMAPDQFESLTDDGNAEFVWGAHVSRGLDSGAVQVLGRDLVLAMRPRESEELALKLEINVPRLKNEKSQIVQLFVNGSFSGQVLHLTEKHFDNWAELTYCLGESLINIEYDNLFHFRMSNAVPQGGRDDLWVSAKARSSRLERVSDCVNSVERIYR